MQSVSGMHIYIYIYNGCNLRSLPIPQQPLLLLQFLDLDIIGGLADELVDVGQGAFNWDVEPSILLADAIADALAERFATNAHGRDTAWGGAAVGHVGRSGDPTTMMALLTGAGGHDGRLAVVNAAKGEILLLLLAAGRGIKGGRVVPCKGKRVGEHDGRMMIMTMKSKVGP